MKDVRQQLREMHPNYQLQCAARDLIAQLDFRVEFLEDELREANTLIAYFKEQKRAYTDQHFLPKVGGEY